MSKTLIDGPLAEADRGGHASRAELPEAESPGGAAPGEA